MTELEQKAEEYFSHHNYALHNRYGVQKDIHKMIFKDGYEQGYALGENIANSAIESLQKKNAELKEENEKLKKIIEQQKRDFIED